MHEEIQRNSKTRLQVSVIMVVEFHCEAGENNKFLHPLFDYKQLRIGHIFARYTLKNKSNQICQ